jgi:hypothetical protein
MNAMLERTERDVIHAFLVARFATIATLRTSLAAHLPGITSVAEAPNVADTASLIIEWAERERSEELLAMLDSFAPASAGLAEVLKAIRARKATNLAGHDPYRAEVLWDRTVILDRDALRKSLLALARGDRPSTLVVQGPRGSGRSKTRDLVEFCARAKGEEYCVYEEVGRLGVVEIVADLLDAMGVESDVEATPNLDSHWYRAQARKLIKAAKDSKRIWWLIFDDLSQSLEVVELVHHLAQKVASVSQKHIRLVLLDHPKHSNQGLPTGAMDVDSLDLGSITEAHVREFLQRLFDQRLGRPLDQDALDEAVRQIVPPAFSTADDDRKADLLDELSQALDARMRAALSEVGQ